MRTTKTVSTRVTKPLAKLIEKYLELNTHVTPADFIRDAIREKIRREAPDLYRQLFQKNYRKKMQKGGEDVDVVN